MGYLGHVIKKMVQLNPIDALAANSRRRLQNKGKDKLEASDNWVYWHIGMRFFPKILRFTNHLTLECLGDLPRSTFVVVSNHQYALDPFFIGLGIKTNKVCWVSKLDNFKTPLMKSIIAPFGTIPLNRNRKMSKLTLSMIHEAIDHGYAIGMFPEGGRSKKGILEGFHAGAARICLERRIPYVPVAITGKRVFFKGKCHVKVGKPVYLDPCIECGYENAKNIAYDMRAQVQALLDSEKEIPKCRYEIDNRQIEEVPVLQ
jgi:1-acyl-sn-glycerol-3-phosphate acyltransferase